MTEKLLALTTIVSRVALLPVILMLTPPTLMTVSVVRVTSSAAAKAIPKERINNKTIIAGVIRDRDMFLLIISVDSILGGIIPHNILHYRMIN